MATRASTGALYPMETRVVQLQLEIPKAGLNWLDIDFTFFLNTRQGDIFKPSPPRAKVITQDAINQVGKLLMARAREIFFFFEQVLQSCNYLMNSTFFMVDRAEATQSEPHILGFQSAQNPITDSSRSGFNHKASCGVMVS